MSCDPCSTTAPDRAEHPRNGGIKIQVHHRPAPLVVWSDHFDPSVLAGSDADQISKSPPMVAGRPRAEPRGGESGTLHTRQAAEGASLAPAPGTAKKADLAPLVVVEGGDAVDSTKYCVKIERGYAPVPLFTHTFSALEPHIGLRIEHRDNKHPHSFPFLNTDPDGYIRTYT